jgi:hypothetical protein
MGPTAEWLKIWEEKREFTLAPNDLDLYFSEKEINEIKVDQINLGDISLPSGKIIVNDPLGQYLALDNNPYFIETPKGEFPMQASIITYEDDGEEENLIACVKIAFANEKPVRYEEALKGIESIEDLNEGEFFGFASESGLATIVDADAKEAFVKLIDEVEAKDENLYDDYFAPFFAENVKNNPKYQSEDGDWINWTIPNTEYKVPIFQAGFGEGVYPSYFGYNAAGEVVAFYIQFIDAELEDDSEDDEWI